MISYLPNTVATESQLHEHLGTCPQVAPHNVERSQSNLFPAHLIRRWGDFLVEKLLPVLHHWQPSGPPMPSPFTRIYCMTNFQHDKLRPQDPAHAEQRNLHGKQLTVTSSKPALSTIISTLPSPRFLNISQCSANSAVSSCNKF